MRTKNNLMAQIFSFFALVRVQNIILLSIAFFLTSKYFFATRDNFWQLLNDHKFIALLLATTISIASGYIINGFYDLKKDMINRPDKTLLELQLSQTKRLYLYFGFNLLAVIIASFISWRAALFFSVYIFLIWFYSHKIQNIVFINNLWMTILSIFPFFGIFLYFKKVNSFILWHAGFLFLILLIKNMLKDFINIKGDMVENKQTLPIIYGEQKSKNIILIISIITFIPVIRLLQYNYIGNMRYYFYFAILLYATGFIWFYFKSVAIRYFYIVVKFLIAIGVFAVMLIQSN